MNLIKYNAETFDDVHSLFSHYDIGTVRTFSDSVKAFGVMGKTGLKLNHITRTAGAIRYMRAGFPRGASTLRISTEDMINFVYDWQTESLQIFNSLLEGESIVSRRLRLAACLSVLLVIMRYNPEKGVKFISKVSTDDGLNVGDPRKALNRFLRDTVARREHTGRVQVTNGQLSYAVAKAWNKYITNIQVKTIKVNNTELTKNIVIKGTPYTGEFPTVG